VVQKPGLEFDRQRGKRCATSCLLAAGSQAMEAFLLHRVQPEYPPLAREVGVQGTVVLSAIIGKDGTIENLHVLSGHPMLVRAALDAVEQWRYRPYLLNGEAVEVETRITVNFVLSGR
jgi:periplasmic protein TonB